MNISAQTYAQTIAAAAAHDTESAAYAAVAVANTTWNADNR